MKNSTQISVKKPCNEKFQNFLVTSNGGFCNSCSKEVIDFTRMTDTQLLAHLKKSQGETCGRFKKSQLKTYNTNSFTPMISNSLLGTLSFSLLALCVTPDIHAQDNAATPEKLKTELSISKNNTSQNNISIEKYTVKGLVQDENNTPLPDVSIVLKGSTVGTTTDYDGNFEFPRQLNVNDVLVFNYIGFESQEYKVKAGESEIIELTITFDYSDIELLGEVVVGGAFVSKRNIFQKFADLFRK